ncbi:patatin-like protein 6 [Cucurbita pepo subsp. pepo]|uniref:Patatin n=1 Tax=Cucurbita moschata TaxID=3662 RepID=A0A6J1FDX2_CUCMO|nr:patatin-like protein 6 [Cucurbita moschata]XP_022938711.1 patatin-like protein 6 [Cucurbita moschata]XP_023550383.1 patatin-like protein 6 [Cucurbita pepo subsp. pepo]
MQEPSIDTDKLSYEIFSILESNFLFGYEDQKLWIPKQIPPSVEGKLISDTGSTQAYAQQEASRDASSIRNQRGKVCILSIDGGGMGGILSGKALAYLEQALKSKSGNPDARIADYFDVAAGAGVGGIFTAMLFATKDHIRPIYKAEDTWRFLADQGQRFYRRSTSSSGGGLFGRLLKINCTNSTSSPTAALEKAMKEAFTDKGRSLTLKDTLKPVLVPCYDLSTTAPFLFSRADALEKDSFNFRLWEVCRATSAEPAIFEPVTLRSVDNQTKCLAMDGGLGMSNPTAAAITHVLHNKQEFPFVRGVEDLLVLSLGTGQPLEARRDYRQVKRWKEKEWIRPMNRISGEASADMVDQAVAMAFGQSRSSNYVRIQALGSSLGQDGPNSSTDSDAGNVKMLVQLADEVLKQKNVESVLFGGKRFSEQTNFEKLDWFAGELVLEHQRRGCRIAPTVAFKQATTREGAKERS